MTRFVRSIAVVATAFASIASDLAAVQAACGTVPFGIKVPTEFGLDKCVGNHVWDLLGMLVGSTFQCSVFKIVDLTKSESLASTTSLLSKIIASPEKISATLYDAMKTTTDAQMDTFCRDWSSLVSPCAEALLPKFLTNIKDDVECCGQISDVVDMLNLVVPPDVSKESFLLTEVVNGVNQFLCAKRQDTKQTCGASVFKQLTTKYTSTNFRVIESFLLPFVSAVAGQECNAFQGQPYVSSLSHASTSSIDYSCCVDYMRPLLESVQNGFEYVVSNTPLEFLNGIVEFSGSDSSKKAFVDALKNAKTCTYKATCAAPSGLTKYEARTITPGTNNPKKNELKDTTCIKATKCDAKGIVCSEVCAKGSVTLPVWVSQSLKYQRKLAYSGPMCFAQLPATHNSAINLADGFGNRDQLMNLNLNPKKPYSYMKTNNHVLSVVDQLNVGVRFLEIDVHYFLKALRTAHCGNLGSNSIQVLASTLKEQLTKYGTVNWSADLLGCFPSLSGIRAEEQRTALEAMQEIRTWLDKPEHKDELVIVYLDTGSELRALNKLTDLNALLTSVFGDLIVPMAEWDALKSAGWTGESATLQRFIDQGRRVVLLANENTGLAYRLGDFCKGHRVLSTDFLNALPDTSRVIGGKKIYSGDFFLRSYQSVLRYISLSDAGTLSQSLPTVFNAGNVYNYVRWNVNLVATDALDGSMVPPQIWSWAENEPRTTNATATVYVSTDGRWRASSSQVPMKKACWNASTLKWSIVDGATACAAGTSFAGPTDPYQNYLLQQEIMAQMITAGVMINATVSK